MSSRNFTKDHSSHLTGFIKAVWGRHLREIKKMAPFLIVTIQPMESVLFCHSYNRRWLPSTLISSWTTLIWVNDNFLGPKCSLIALVSCRFLPVLQRKSFKEVCILWGKYVCYMDASVKLVFSTISMRHSGDNTSMYMHCQDSQRHVHGWWSLSLLASK